MNVGDTVRFPWGPGRTIEGVIESIDGPKAQVLLAQAKDGKPIWINTALLRKVLK